MTSSAVEFNPLLPEFHSDPYPFYRRLREEDPVHHSAAVIGAANRDPAHFHNPDRLDIARQENRHIAFGFGIHFCLGAPLARIEGQVAIGTLLRRIPALKLLSDTPEWRESSVLRGLKTLPVMF